jgi:hypothetical protein
MSTQITTAVVHEWERGITHLAEQKMSRFRGKTRMTRIGAGDEKFIDQIGSVTAQIRTTRHGDTPLTDTPHSRRQVPLNPYEHADLVDEPDKLRTLNDPTNEYMVAFGRAFGRAMDDEVIGAAFAAANTGVTGGTPVNHPGGDFQIAASTAGMTLAKILEANQVLREAENDPDEGFFFAVAQEQIADMLAITELSSADFVSVRSLMTGTITEFMGFTWIPTERLLLDGSDDRRCIAWAKNSLLLAIGKEPSGRISERADKSYSTQVFMSMDIGATRLDETGVVEVLCEEA